MVICIDESGTHKREGKSVIVLVYVALDELEVLDELVLQAEKAAGIYRFHWSHRNWQMRKMFVEAIAKGNFKVKVAYITNPIILNKALIEALRHLIVERNINKIFIDGDKPKVYNRQLKKVLRDKGTTVRKIRSVNDESYPIIRIADAVAGLLRSYNDSPMGKSASLIKLVEPKIELQINI
jgi:hypothetical protein